MANIEARQKVQRLYRNTITEWQTRTLAQFIAATIDTGGKKNPVAEEALKIRLRMEDEAGKSDDDTPIEQIIEEGSKTASNSTGSYERLMAGFGGLPGA